MFAQQPRAPPVSVRLGVLVAQVPGWPPYKAFGGWTKPAIHQFSDAGNACGVRYDKNYY